MDWASITSNILYGVTSAVEPILWILTLWFVLELIRTVRPPWKPLINHIYELEQEIALLKQEVMLR